MSLPDEVGPGREDVLAHGQRLQRADVEQETRLEKKPTPTLIHGGNTA